MRKITKITKRAVAYLLTLVMVLNVALSAMPAMSVNAAESGKRWIKITGGSGNAGGHSYGGATAGPAYLENADRKAADGEEITVALKPSVNWGVFLSYFDDNNWLYVGYDTFTGWYYQYRFQADLSKPNEITESYPKLQGLPALTENVGTQDNPDHRMIVDEVELTVSLNRETLSVTVNGVNTRVPNSKLIDYANATFEKGRVGTFGVMTKGQTSIQFTDFTYGGEECMNDDWEFCAERTGQIVEDVYADVIAVTGTVVDGNNVPVAGAKVYVGRMMGRTDAEGNYSVSGVEPGENGREYVFTVTKGGYYAYTQNVTVSKTEKSFNAKIEAKPAVELESYDVIQSNEMKVYIGKDFPVVARYVMTSDESGQTFFRGNEMPLNQIKINGMNIKPVVTVEETTANSRTYSLVVMPGEEEFPVVTDEDGSAPVVTDENGSAPVVTDENGSAPVVADVVVDHNIRLQMKVKISVDGNDLTWEVTELKKAANCDKIATIDIPELNLLSVDISEEESVFAGAQTSTTTTYKADKYITFDKGFYPGQEDGYLYAFLSNGKLSAGIFSNSEKEGDKRVERINGSDYMALNSAEWYYECGDATQMASTLANGYTYPVSDLPCAKVCIAGDMNDDKQIDWNDGAIAYRDIMHVAYGAEVVKDAVNHRIVMNFSSMAPNPFLATADGIKKVYLATDGLPQAIILKGYGNEGHDSANSEYADVAEREGGIEDFRELIRIAHEYSTQIGIHVNAQEAYPEARSFCEEMLNAGFGWGWGWLDQSHVINKLWDLSSGARYKRMVQLYDRINETTHLNLDWEAGQYVAPLENNKNATTGTLTDMENIQAEAEEFTDNMDLIYLDVWYQDAWETRQIAKQFNSLGWRFSTEFSAEGEYDSTWQHWSTDAKYGGKTAKGFNSDIIRFIRNDQRDSQVLNHPAYGGTADNPLLGGYRLYGFEGWGGDQDFNNYIFQTFNQNLPTRFLQHYEVIDWENYEKGKSPVGNTEKEIKLKSGNDIVVVTRNEEQRRDDEIERKITLNGKTVLNCDVNGSSYLLPWTNAEEKEEKLYHWNLDGGTTTWELQNDWTCKTVNVYAVTDQGRGEAQVVDVVNGTITLTAEAAQIYVVTKGGSESTVELKEDFGESAHVVDPGFNGYLVTSENAVTPLDATDWKVTAGNGELTDDSVYVDKAPTGDQRLVINSPVKDVEATIKLTDLEDGKEYVAEVYVDNRSQEKAGIQVVAGEKTSYAYAGESFASNYVQCDQEHVSNLYDSKMQRMQVSFTAVGKTAELTLSREAGVGITYFDDIRIVKKALNNYRYNKENGEFECFVQDFETVVQGLYPFVIGPSQGVTDHRTHLSQLHAPFTQAGWAGKVIDDVITDGTINGEKTTNSNWSLKHHTQSTGIVYHTIPQNFRFEAGKVYDVEFDYQAGAAGYKVAIGEGALENGFEFVETSYLVDGKYTEPAVAYLAATTGTKHVAFQITGSESGQTWFGIYQDGNANDGYGKGDFVLDNLVIKENAKAVGIARTELYVGETALITAGAAAQTITSSNEKVITVDKGNGIINAVSAGTADITFLNAEGEELGKFTVTVKGSEYEVYPMDDLNVTVSANTEQTSSEPEGCGIIGAVIDGNSATYWHSQWSGAGFSVSESNPAVITLDFGEEIHIAGFMFQQRHSAINGIVKKYSYVAKDKDGNVVRDKDGNEVAKSAITTTEQQQANGAIVNVLFDEVVDAKVIEFSILDGKTDQPSTIFATLAEIAPLKANTVAVAGEVTLEDAKVAVNKRITLEPVCKEGTFVKGLTWTSDDPKIATVNENGEVIGLAAGKVTITATNSLGVNASCTVTVCDDASKYIVTLSEDAYTYNGNAHVPNVEKVTNAKGEDVEGYEVNYSNEESVDAGTYEVTVTFNTDTIVGEVTKTYVINKAEALDNVTVELAKQTFTYNGLVQTPQVAKVKIGDTELTSEEYTVKYANAYSTKVGEYKVNVSLKNYAGTYTADYEITAVDTTALNVVLSKTSFTYNARAQKPKVTVTDSIGNIIATSNYEVSYENINSTNAGTYKVTVTFVGENCTGADKEATYTINPADSANLTVVVSDSTTYTYDGNEHKPTVSVRESSTGRVITTSNYDVSYVAADGTNTDSINAGSYKVIVSFKGNYSGTKDLSYTINPASSAGFNVTLSANSYTYNGEVHTPVVTVMDGTGNAVATSNYDVRYTEANSTNVGTYKVTVNFKGNYTGSKELTYTINPADSETLTVELSETTYTYDGEVHTPVVTVMDDTGNAVATSNYEVSYENINSTNAGTYKVTVNFKGNYTGSKELTYTINPASKQGLALVLSATSYEYNGSVQKPTVTVKDAAGQVMDSADYTVVYSNVSSKEVGTYTVTVTFKNYEGTLTATYEIKAKAPVVNPDDTTKPGEGTTTKPGDTTTKPETKVETIADANVTLSATSMDYTGSALQPAVTVKVGTATLVAGTDYTVTYQNNTNIGTASVVVTGKGNYTGTVTKTFAIAAKNGATFTISSYKYKVTGATEVAFTGASKKNVKTVKIPGTVTIGGVSFKVTSIANNALKKNTKLTSVTIGANVKTIGNSAFEGCKKLSKVTIGNNVTKIGSKAFKGCKVLKKIAIPKKVITIGKEAFAGCSKLANITIKATNLKKIESKAFKGIKSNAKIKVSSKKKLASYKKMLKKAGVSKKAKITK